jgi:hypothetical protein
MYSLVQSSPRPEICRRRSVRPNPEASATFINDSSGRGAMPRPGCDIEPRNRVCHLDYDIIQSMLKGKEATKILKKLVDCIYKKLDALAVSINGK